MEKYKDFDTIIFTDGSSHGNPGPGGWAALIISNGKKRTISGGYKRTTNNRMELMAAINALSGLKKPGKVCLITDSDLINKAFNEKWISGWIKRGWKKSDKKPVVNAELWSTLYDLVNKYEVKIFWTKAHVGTPENELVDKLANEAAEKDDLPPDESYDDPDSANSLPLESISSEAEFAINRDHPDNFLMIEKGGQTMNLSYDETVRMYKLLLKSGKNK